MYTKVLHQHICAITSVEEKIVGLVALKTKRNKKEQDKHHSNAHFQCFFICISMCSYLFMTEVVFEILERTTINDHNYSEMYSQKCPKKISTTVATVTQSDYWITGYCILGKADQTVGTSN